MIDGAREHQNLHRVFRCDEFFQEARRRGSARKIQVENHEIGVVAVFCSEATGVFRTGPRMNDGIGKLGGKKRLERRHNQCVIVYEQELHDQPSKKENNGAYFNGRGACATRVVPSYRKSG